MCTDHCMDVLFIFNENCSVMDSHPEGIIMAFVIYSSHLRNGNEPTVYGT